MKTILVCAGLLLAIRPALRAQEDLSKQMTRDRLNSQVGVAPGGIIFGLKGAPGQLLGDPYLDSTFQTGNVVFYQKLNLPDVGPGDMLVSIPLRLDLRSNEVEFRTKSQGVRVAPWPMVRSFGVLGNAADTSWFVNVREYNPIQIDNKMATGFFEQLVVGRISLLRYSAVSLTKANYNAALNVGSKDDLWEKKAGWYVAEGRMVKPFSPGKKALIALMGDKAPEIEAYLKAKKPDLKSKDDLKAAFQYYNSLNK